MKLNIDKRFVLVVLAVLALLLVVAGSSFGKCVKVIKPLHLLNGTPVFELEVTNGTCGTK